MEIQNSKDMDQPWVHVFLYGESGSGKTRAASTFPRPLFIQPANEGSMATLSGKDFPFVEVRDMKDMMEVINTLEAQYKKSPDDFPYETIVFEAFTHYFDLAVEDMTGGGRLQMDQQRWGSLASHVRHLQTRIRNMDVNVVFIALSKLDPGGEGRTPVGGPALSGKSANMLPASCDIVGYCEAKEGSKKHPEPTYHIHFRRRSYYFARSRFAGVPPSVENFCFTKHIEPHTLVVAMK